jgi:cytochrome c oxidase subunit IV
MTAEKDVSGMLASKIWRRNGLIWAVLMLLLLLTLALAYVPMGRLSPAIGIVIAAIKAGLVVLLFMELADARPLIRLAAMAGIVFLVALFLLTLADVLSRLT